MVGRRFCILVLWVVCLFGCHFNSDPDPGEREAASAATQSFEAGVEAKAWLAEPNHGVRRLDRALVSTLVRKLYTAGAVEVRTGELEAVQSAGGSEFAGSLIVKLPADPGKRLDVYKAINRFLGQQTPIAEPVKEGHRDYVSIELE